MNPTLRHLLLAVAILALLSLLPLPIAAQQVRAGAAPDSLGGAGSDTDPTKPVLFSLRNAYYDLGGDLWQNVVVLRRDRLLLRRTEFPGHARGVLTRIELPVVSFHTAAGTTIGLGDLYAQGLVLPNISGNFFMATGMGLVLPTASENTLGGGKWIAAPAIVPIWRFQRKGFSYVKLQDFISFAGASDRDDVHYLSVRPAFLWRLSQRWWTFLDAELTTDWKQDAQSSARTGALLGYMVSRRVGLSVKVGQYYGDHRQAHWAVEAILFVTKF